MNWIMTVLALGLVIFIHELGHFLAAKRAGIGVFEFAIGMGPVIWSKKWGETQYSLRILPIGGYIKMAGLEETENIPDELNFYKKSLFDRLLTILAGPLVNIFAGWLVFVLLFAIAGQPILRPTITQIAPNGVAARAHLIAGDTIVAINNKPIQDVLQDVVLTIHKSNNHPLMFQVRRQNSTFNVEIKPEGKIPQIGIMLASTRQHFGIIHAIIAGTQEAYRQIVMVGTSLKQLATGQVHVRDIAGPVGILQMASSGFSRGIVPFLSIIAMINISLGIANLLPFPVLDGGHVVLLLIEGITGKRLPQKVEQGLFYLGAAILIGLMLIIGGNDIFQFKDRVQILKGLK